MDTNNGGSSGSSVKKQEDPDTPTDSKGSEKRDSKPVVKTLNRVPRTHLFPLVSLRSY